MKNKLFMLLLITSINLFASDKQEHNLNNKQILKDFVSNDSKISLVDKNIKSIGHKYLSAELDKVGNLSNYEVVEIYNTNISNEWKVSIFDIELQYFDGTKDTQKRKIFYNKSLVVNDIFNEKAESIGKKINLPLMSNLVYNEEYQLLKRDINKPTLNGENMVIFTNSQCPFCKQYVPAMFDYAFENNMNLYVINLSSKKFTNSDELTKRIISFLKYDKRSSSEKLQALKIIYANNFSSKDEFLDKEFSNLIGLGIETLKNKDHINYSQELLEINNKIAKKIHVIETPTVYIDGVLFVDYGVK